VKLRWRLALLNGVVVLVVLLISVGILLFTTRVAMERDVDRNLRRQLESGSRMIVNRPPDARMRGPGIAGPPESPLRVFDNEGRSLRQNPPQRPFDPRALGRANPQPQYSTVTDEARLVRVVTQRVIDPQGQEFVVQVGIPRENIDNLLRAQVQLALSLIPLALVLATMAGWFLAGRAVDPLARFSLTAAGISEASMAERMPADDDEEIATLGKTFNAMLDRLQGSFALRDAALRDVEASLERQKQFVADASHELRTPLTRMKLVASAAGSQDSDAGELREALAVVNKSADAMEHLIDQLLMLARSTDGGQRLGPKATVSLGVWLSEILPDDVPLRVEQEVSRSIQPESMERVILNLVSNAQRHAEQPEVWLIAVDSDAVVEVADRGPGVPEEALGRLTERFFRVDSARARKDGGTGLGLAIADAIVRAHGGKLEFRNREGGGLVARVSLPL
jgi:two-component system, OmpR family, sensor kinase